MAILAIDYGAKKVGVAMTDESKSVVFPKMVLPNDRFLLGEVNELIKEYKIDTVVIGDSVDFKGRDNPIMNRVRAFGAVLARDSNVNIEWINETFSSEGAKRMLIDEKDTAMLDASAAALLLESYLEMVS